MDYFSSGKKLSLSDDLSLPEYSDRLEGVAGLKDVVKKYFNTNDKREMLLRMEFVLEALHQNNMLSREVHDSIIQYTDVFSDMLKDMGGFN